MSQVGQPDLKYGDYNYKRQPCLEHIHFKLVGRMSGKNQDFLVSYHYHLVKVHSNFKSFFV